MTLRDAYVASVVGLLALVAVTVLLAFRQRSIRRFKAAELATLALLICLLYVAAIPWQVGLAKVPGIDALVFSIPYTAVLLLGLRHVAIAAHHSLSMARRPSAGSQRRQEIHEVPSGASSSLATSLPDVPGAEGGEGGQSDRLLDELDVGVGEQDETAARVETEWLVVVLGGHRGGPATRQPAAFGRSVRPRPVQAVRAFAVRPADSLAVRQARVTSDAGRSIRPPPCGPL